MNLKEQKKSKNRSYFLLLLCSMLIGAVCGILILKYLVMSDDNLETGEILLNWAATIIVFYIALYLQIIIHEAGHMIAGLFSGYTFSSFRIGSLMWIKDNKKIKFRRLSLAGTGGQCLMNPPDMANGKIPFVFYNLGGSLMNLVTIPVCALLLICLDKLSLVSLFLLIMCVIGFLYALMNGVPMKFGVVNNDGSNTLELSKSPEALRSFWIRMKVMELTSKRVRIKDMPDEWFYLPDKNGLKNSMTAGMAVLYENRLMDELAFDEAKELIDELLNTETGIVGIHLNMLICDRLYCELIKDKDSEVIKRLYSKEQIKFMNKMRKFPSVIRTEYAYSLLYLNDVKKAAKLKKQFEKRAKTYPYITDIESERELLEIVDVLIKDCT